MFKFNRRKMNNKISFDHKCNLLYSSINDAIQSLRVIEGRTGVLNGIATFIVGIETSVFLEILRNYDRFKNCKYLCSIFLVLTVAGIACLMFCFTFLIKALKSIKYKEGKINPELSNYKSIWHIKSDSFLNINDAVVNHVSKLDKLTENEYLEYLSYELHVLSTLRDHKKYKLEKTYYFVSAQVLIIVLKIAFLFNIVTSFITFNW